MVSPDHLLQSTSLSAPPSDSNWSIWDSGEWWMLLAAQSMAVGTVMVRWVSKFSDPIMATGWVSSRISLSYLLCYLCKQARALMKCHCGWQHMILGGLPLLALSVYQQDPAVTGHIQDLSAGDLGALFYTSLFGSAVSYGVFFYNATRGAALSHTQTSFCVHMTSISSYSKCCCVLAGNLTKLSSLTFLTPMFAAVFG